MLLRIRILLFVKAFLLLCFWSWCFALFACSATQTVRGACLGATMFPAASNAPSMVPKHAVVSAVLPNQVDLEVADLAFGPTTLDTYQHPEGISFSLLNHGPAPLMSDTPVVAEFYLATNETTAPSASLFLGDVTFALPLAPGASVVVQLSPTGRSFLQVPTPAAGPYHPIVRTRLPAGLDPDESNNTFASSQTVTVYPLTAPYLGVFSSRGIVSREMDIEVSGDFVPNSSEPNSWRVMSQGSGFSAKVLAPGSGTYLLVVNHLTSASTDCSNDGYSPVSLYLNGVALAQWFDPAEQHEGSHGFVTDTWTLSLAEGENIIALVAEELCTHYWIRRLELFPDPMPFRFTRATTSGALTELELDLAIGLAYILEGSSDLVSWRYVNCLTNTTGRTAITMQAGDSIRFFRGVIR